MPVMKLKPGHTRRLVDFPCDLPFVNFLFPDAYSNFETTLYKFHINFTYFIKYNIYFYILF